MAEVLLWQQQRNSSNKRIIRINEGKEYAKHIAGYNAPFIEKSENSEPEKLNPSRFADLIAEVIKKYDRKIYKIKILVNKGEKKKDESHTEITIQDQFFEIEKEDWGKCESDYRNDLEEYCSMNYIYAVYLID